MNWENPEDIPESLRKSYKKHGEPTIPSLLSGFVLVLHLHAEKIGIKNQDKQSAYVQKFMENFRKLQTNNERMDVVYPVMQKYNLIKNNFVLDQKSDLKATECKDKGNRCFGTEEFPKAFRYYTKMLMNARSQELKAIAHANRSATLFKLEMYKDCIIEIDKAFADNYPDQMRPKLLSRRTKAAELLHKAVETPGPYEEPPNIPTNKRNPSISCASNCITVKTDDKSRPRVYATKDIRIGEVIAVESPFSAAIAEPRLYHCHECFELCYTTIPCDNCTQTIYCSDNCKQNAYNQYHKDECPILMSVKRSVGKHKFFLLAIRMSFLKRDESSDEVLKLTPQLHDENPDHDPDTDNRLMSALSACLLFDLVKKHTKRFEGVDNPEQAERVYKETLMSYVRLCNVKTTGVDELPPRNPREFVNRDRKYDVVAFAIYPFHAMFRHSCCPNVFGHHHGLKRVLRAFRTIKKGQECFVNYGGTHYSCHTKEERQNYMLTQHNFLCKCRACVEDWPLLDRDFGFHFLDFFFPMLRLQLEEDEIEGAKNLAGRKIRQLRAVEALEPNADVNIHHKSLFDCYDRLANKRHIL